MVKSPISSQLIQKSRVLIRAREFYVRAPGDRIASAQEEIHKRSRKEEERTTAGMGECYRRKQKC